jgi:hypothetical protein
VSPESDLSSGFTVWLPASGGVNFYYGDQDILTDVASGVLLVQYRGGRTINLPLRQIPVANIFDAFGTLFGIPRFVGEDNLAYKQRLLAEAVSPATTDRGGVIRGVASRLGQLHVRAWDGVSTLQLDTTGASGITALRVVEFPRFREITETLSPSGLNRFIATHDSWRPGYLILVDGVPDPEAAVAGNVVTLARIATGAVSATYSIEQWSTTSNVSGTIHSLLPGTGIPSGDWRVLYACHVQAYPVDLPSVKQGLLLQANGLPNQLFLELAHRLTEDNPTAFGRARWGSGAAWFVGSDERPALTRLPIVFDDTSE